jgi:hypothetical protein
MFSAKPIKIQITFLTEVKNSILKFIGKQKKTQIAKEILSKKSNTGGITVPDFEFY